MGSVLDANRGGRGPKKVVHNRWLGGYHVAIRVNGASRLASAPLELLALRDRADKGALIEGDFAGMAAQDAIPDNSIVTMVDGVAMVTREPIDRLQQIIAQSWYWIGGFCAPTDTTTNPTTVPTATNAAYKRAVMVEHFG